MIASFCRICASKYSRLLESDRSVKNPRGSDDKDKVEELEDNEAEEEALSKCDIFQGAEGKNLQDSEFLKLVLKAFWMAT
jgi:hypothetical protein